MQSSRGSPKGCIQKQNQPMIALPRATCCSFSQRRALRACTGPRPRSWSWRTCSCSSLDARDLQPTSILACLGRRQSGWRHHQLLATSDAACARACDLTSGVFRHDAAPAFRTGVSGDCRSEVILRTDIGADHVMKHRKQFQCGAAARRAHRLTRFNLHLAPLRTTSATACSKKPEEANQHAGDAGGKLGVVHANIDRRVQRRRQSARIKADPRDLGRRAVTG